MKVYNTITGQKEEFKTQEPGEVKMYVCGLTVQNYSHIGHVRGAINYDVIRRYLRHKGYDVNYIQNFTDINEKIVKRAEEEGMAPMELAEKYSNAYINDLKRLNVEMPDEFCRVSENIDKIIEIIETLISKGHAYESEGNVYFSVESFDDYGKLSGRNVDEMEAGSRVEVDENKKHPMDFALWKSYENDPTWDSPWGKGWPGWHIECSAMSMKYLGGSIDIHGGGTDLVFPHHENEIAQSEAYSGEKPFVKYWLHNGTVDMSGEKMSKSIGNTYWTKDLLEDFSSDEIRYYILTKHYRSPINFSIEELKNSSRSLKRLISTLGQLDKVIDNYKKNRDNDFIQEDFIDVIKSHRTEFEEAMDDDFNTAKAISVLHGLSKEINSFINSSDFKPNDNNIFILKEARRLFRTFADVLGLKLEPDLVGFEDREKFSKIMEILIDAREEARDNNYYDLADKIRDDLDKINIRLKDTPRGTTWEYTGDERDDS